MTNFITCFLIDDDVDDQEIFELALRDVDHSIKCYYANDGVEAVNKLNSEIGFIPDFIFLDLNMPRMNGIQCLAQIKKITRLKDVPVIMYSTSSDSKFINEAKKNGASDYLTKPSSIRQLTNVLSLILTKTKID
jgi:CheY-like chemotaxis protein